MPQHYEKYLSQIHQSKIYIFHTLDLHFVQ